ncbi:hypothetical protein K2173_022431 [Erythroxylum novogranatense]|uniref:Uncharacterized protein n=1 Tax=Erythroxylum novogranatense TaxID=1862640 RepID=A0AAV8THL3_9ROSI|nr:hypothetical protein K2173_022431 [Erythroxylum novogranatense]
MLSRFTLLLFWGLLEDPTQPIKSQPHLLIYLRHYYTSNTLFFIFFFIFSPSLNMGEREKFPKMKAWQEFLKGDLQLEGEVSGESKSMKNPCF